VPTTGRRWHAGEVLNARDVAAAAQRIAGYVRRTPVIEVAAGQLADVPLVLKLELLQLSGSFKARGAFNFLLTHRPRRVVTASGGNHGLAVAVAAAALGVEAEVFVPTTTPATKLHGLRLAGAVVHQVGADYAEAATAAVTYAADRDAPYLPAYDHPDVVAGQGTSAFELVADAPEVETVLVAVGGGGLIGGMAAWYRGRTKLIGVEPRTSRALWAALDAGEPVDVEVSGVAADSLGARRVGELMLPLAKEFVQRVVLVDDAAIVAAQKALWRAIRIVAEPGGAAALAAVLSGAYAPAPDERVGVLVCGANCDPGSVA
jgi:threonine dehydratase